MGESAQMLNAEGFGFAAPVRTRYRSLAKTDALRKCVQRAYGVVAGPVI
jgi:hypothetical protein